MAIEYTWTISDLKRTNDNDQGVVKVDYRVTATEGQYTKGAYGSMSFNPDPSAEDYIPFANLTEETVIEWVKEALNNDETSPNIEAILQKKIEQMKNPPTVSEMPWKG